MITQVSHGEFDRNRNLEKYLTDGFIAFAVRTNCEGAVCCVLVVCVCVSSGCGVVCVALCRVVVLVIRVCVCVCVVMGCLCVSVWVSVSVCLSVVACHNAAQYNTSHLDTHPDAFSTATTHHDISQ